ncbi:MAG TPA: dihydropteroate synthase [Xanthomonadales bacterium]|nr:dihydropteroate synthase [Xanthomonadales bacterium]
MNLPEPHAALNCGRFAVRLDRPCIMGILNLTPDSFSDGGLWLEPDQAVRHALDMVADGADILDVGGESTRPGAQAVVEQAELDRVIPVIERLASEIAVPISVDTSKPQVMKAAVAAGATMINDVCALRQQGALDTAASLGVPVCLMHMQGQPRDMQHNPNYQDVVAEVRDFLDERTQACRDAGISRHEIVIDPGFGFGKSLQHNLDLLNGIVELKTLGFPVMAGLSRKSMLGAITGRETGDRVIASAAAAMLAVQNGAAIVRVHDVRETADALKVLAASRASTADPY